MDTIYIKLEQRRPEIITINNMDYALLLRPVKLYLPFEIELLDFNKVMHPVTTNSFKKF